MVIGFAILSATEGGEDAMLTAEKGGDGAEE